MSHTLVVGMCHICGKTLNSSNKYELADGTWICKECISVLPNKNRAAVGKLNGISEFMKMTNFLYTVEPKYKKKFNETIKLGKLHIDENNKLLYVGNNFQDKDSAVLSLTQMEYAEIFFIPVSRPVSIGKYYIIKGDYALEYFSKETLNCDTLRFLRSILIQKKDSTKFKMPREMKKVQSKINTMIKCISFEDYKANLTRQQNVLDYIN